MIFNLFGNANQHISILITRGKRLQPHTETLVIVVILRIIINIY
jgi:hypothetical protein